MSNSETSTAHLYDMIEDEDTPTKNTARPHTCGTTLVVQIDGPLDREKFAGCVHCGRLRGFWTYV